MRLCKCGQLRTRLYGSSTLDSSTTLALGATFTSFWQLPSPLFPIPLTREYLTIVGIEKQQRIALESTM